jgi:hypothetical protein
MSDVACSIGTNDGIVACFKDRLPHMSPATE